MRKFHVFNTTFIFYVLLIMFTLLNENIRAVIYSRGYKPHEVAVGMTLLLLNFLAMNIGWKIWKFKIPNVVYEVVIILFSFIYFPIGPVIAFILLFFYRKGVDVYSKSVPIAFVYSLLIPILAFLVIGVPLFNQSLRFEFSRILGISAYLSTIAITYSNIDRRIKLVYTLMMVAIFFIGTFRSYILWITVAYLLSISKRDVKAKNTIIVGIAGIAILILSGNIEKLLVRIGFTFLTFTNLAVRGIPWGIYHGSLLFSPDPRRVVATFLGGEGRYTYLIFGQPVADFGILGIIESFLIGIMAKESEIREESLNFTISILVYSIDAGIDNRILLAIMGAILSGRVRNEEGSSPILGRIRFNSLPLLGKEELQRSNNANGKLWE
ncbi:hypothetical protein QDY65_06710 [Pyrococcus kukulkanii]|uniref:hypothetical protein n=1 Tax=Pyrococcus kukulkanii TaxID=1609559 RepID=UPI0035647B89